MPETFLLFLLMLVPWGGLAADDAKIDDISVDKNDNRLVLVEFDMPLPDVADINKPEYWVVYSKRPQGVRKHTVVGVETSLFSAEHIVVLQLTQDLPSDWEDMDVSLVNDKTILHVAPEVVTKPIGPSPAQPELPFEGAKNRDDSDVYFKGSYTGVVDGDPVWDIDAFAGYMKAIQRGTRYWGKLGLYGQAKTSASKKADLDSFLAYLVYQRLLGRSWWGPFQAPYLNYRFGGWEFDRTGKQLNFITSPVLTIPFRLSGKLAGPIQPGLTFPHITLQLGTEFVNVWKTALTGKGDWYTRGLLGVTFSAGYAPEKNLVHSILLTSSYQVRFPSSPEIFYDDRFAPVDPVTGKKGDTPPMLGTQPRHYLDSQLTYMFVKWAGVSFEHTYGSLPPAFEKTGNTFKLGLTFTLKETSFGRYSILRP